ncbi:hypothetical protein B0H14DRAFT_2569714 [Mycena olivaceomarginata]|nr:hypothetical protein B0H14DRAFT_2569714 [Mycena olivaceomarginata]
MFFPAIDRNCTSQVSDLRGGCLRRRYVPRDKPRLGRWINVRGTNPSRFTETCATDDVRYPGTTVAKEQDLADSEHPKARRFRVRRWAENQQGRGQRQRMGDNENLGFYLCHGDTAAVRKIERPGVIVREKPWRSGSLLRIGSAERMACPRPPVLSRLLHIHSTVHPVIKFTILA